MSIESMMEGRTNSIIKAGLIMILYMFIVLILYFTLSGPFNLLFDTFEVSSFGEATDEMHRHVPNIRWAFNVFFSILAAIAITWFIVWIFHREPHWEFYRR